MKRRTFVKRSMLAGFALSLPSSPILGANDAIRMGVIGVGSFVKIGGRGRADIKEFRDIPGVRVTAICDCDRAHLDYEAEQFKKRGEPVKAVVDFREVLDDSGIDAVSITTPNHWHSLQTIMACQAGKDVFVQKPSSHNLFEGRKMAEAMRKHKRIVQATHGPRNSGETEEAYEYARSGALGEIQCVYGLNYRPRTSIGKVDGPQPVPETCDYNLWCGPAPVKPLGREHLHYDWHWIWDTGNGDLGNMGIHTMDACRWALDQNTLPKRVMSVGGRLGYEDDGETPNTLITLLDYDLAPIIFEVRGLPKDASYHSVDWNRRAGETMDEYHGVRIGAVVICEDGYIQNDAAYSHGGELIKTFTRKRTSTKHNFIEAVRSRKAETLYTDALQGHLSCGLVHMANTSYRVGKNRPPDEIRERAQCEAAFGDAFGRLMDHVRANKIPLDETPLKAGPLLSFDPETERYGGEFADEANQHLSREYREPFVVRDVV